jgi:arabinoxylan arabinofuranohydrolase
MKNYKIDFKRPQVVLLMAAMLLFCITGASAQNAAVIKKAYQKFIHTKAGNPYLPLWEHVPDGEPRVFEDPDRPGKFRAYIIGSHDLRITSYCGPDIRAWSAPVEDLTQWRNEGPIFTYFIDNQWDVMYAPDLVEVKRKNGKKEYYLYPHSRGRGREAMVCKGDRPDGPFKPVNVTADGKGTVPGSLLGFDPAVYIEYVTDPKDPDYSIGFRAYGFWGFQKSSAAQLDQSTMYTLRPGTEVINYLLPASSRYGVLREPNTVYPNILPGQDLGKFNFFEASSIRKVGNKFVTVFSGYSGPEYGVGSSNSTLRYAVADSPLGPWKIGGVVVDSRAPVLNKDGDGIVTTNSGHNTHGSIELINGQWYVFYHRPPRGFGFARQPVVAPVNVKFDQKSVKDGGTVTITGYDPYAADNKWTAKDSKGLEYTGGEVTSEGFHIFGLDPYQYYSAGYASYLSDPRIQQDSWDIWDNHMPIEKAKNGNIIGYKYFGFGGLKTAQKGLKPFAGTKAGNNTQFNVWLTPKTDKTFKVNVWLDGPWDNATWKGKKIAEIVVPANSKQEATQFTADVAKYVDNLDKKHAIYLVAEGTDGDALFDLMGLGFSSKTKKITRPVPPTVSIAVNGQALTLPATPVRSTNANGITEYDLYETTYKLPAGAPIPKATASSNDPAVKISITQGASNTSQAVVPFDYIQFDYKGVVKTYKVVYTQ